MTRKRNQRSPSFQKLGKEGRREFLLLSTLFQVAAVGTCCSVGWLECTLQTPAGKPLLVPKVERGKEHSSRATMCEHGGAQLAAGVVFLELCLMGADLERRGRDNNCWDKAVGGKAGGKGSGLPRRERSQGRLCYCSLWAVLCTPAQSISWMSAQLFYSFWAVKWNDFSFCSESSCAVALSMLWSAWPVSFSIYICCFSLISCIFLLIFFLLPLTILCNLFFSCMDLLLGISSPCV